MSLLGEWEITAVPPGESLSDKPPVGNWKKINLPQEGLYLTQGKAYKGPLHGLKFGVNPADVRYVWYRKDFKLPEAIQEGERIFLHFDAVAFVSDAYLNGHYLGRNIDGFLPFEYDVTDIIDWTGENTLDVRVGTYQVAQELGAPVGNAFKQHGGIWQPVYLETRGGAYLEDIFIRPSVRDRQLSLDLEIGGDEALVDRIRYTVYDGNEPVLERTVEAHKTGQSTVIDWENPVLWWPDNPKLYTLRVELLEPDGTVVDRVDETFGFREVWLEGTGFYLNGKKVHLYGRWTHAPSMYLARAFPEGGDPYLDGSLTVPEGGAYLSPDELWKAHKERGGINVVRLHCQPVPTEYLDAADREGFLLIAETAIDHRPQSREALEHVVNMVKRDRNHPSVIMWSGSNEFYHWIKPRREENTRFMIEVREAMHAADPTRPVSQSAYGATDGEEDVINHHYPTLMQPSYMPNELFWPVDIDQCRRDQVRVLLTEWNQEKPMMLGEVLPPWKMKYESGYGMDYFTLTDRQQRQLDLEQKPYWYSRVALIYRMEDIMHIGHSIGGSGYVDNPMKQRISELAYGTVGGLFFPWTHNWYDNRVVKYELWLSNIGLEDFEGTVTFRFEQGGNILGEETVELAIVQGEVKKLPIEFQPQSVSNTSGDPSPISAYVSGHVGEEAIDLEINQKLRIYPPDPVVRGLKHRVVIWAGASSKEAARKLQQRIASSSFAETVDEIGRFDPVDTLLVLPGGLTADEEGELSPAMAEFTGRGGRVLVLEQDVWNPGWIPSELSIVDDANNTLYADENIQAFAGLAPDALTYWQGDHRVVRKPLFGGKGGPVTQLIDFPVPTVVQLRYGQGIYVLSQALVQEKLGTEPMAGVLLQRLVHYADEVDLPALRDTWLLAGAGSLYAEALTRIGVELGGSGPTVPSPVQLGGHSQLLVDAASVNLRRLSVLLPWVRQGGRLVLHNLGEDQIAEVAGFLDIPLKAGQRQERVKILPRPLSLGISPYTLSFGSKAWPLSALPVVVDAADGEIEVDPASSPMLWGAVPLEEGEVVFDQVQWDLETKERDKADQFGTALMNNLGVPMRSISVLSMGRTAWVPVDLTNYYNGGTLVDLGKFAGKGGGDAVLLGKDCPRGREQLHGIDFVFPNSGGKEKSLVRLNTVRALPKEGKLETFPNGPTQIRVPMRRIHAEEIAFVHGYKRLWGEPYEPPSPEPTVLTYRVVYASGRVVDIPVREGQEVRHMDNTQKGPLPRGELAFSSHTANGKEQNYYLLRWRNPHPEEKIEAIQIVAGQWTTYIPVVFAISYSESALAYD
jgi:hypothetical protein